MLKLLIVNKIDWFDYLMFWNGKRNCYLLMIKKLLEISNLLYINLW